MLTGVCAVDGLLRQGAAVCVHGSNLSCRQLLHGKRDNFSSLWSLPLLSESERNTACVFLIHSDRVCQVLCFDINKIKHASRAGRF